MLDYNHTATLPDHLNAAVDAALAMEDASKAPRDYLGGSRVGHPCERALQFEFAGAPKDEGSAFSGQTLRIFAIGHALEDLAVRWLRAAGLDLYTRKAHRPDGEQFGFSVAGGRIRGHVDGIIAVAPDGWALGVPAIWECKTMNAKNWRETVKSGVAIAKPVYAAQIALYQAYMEASVPGVATNPALFTAINKDTAELYHELVPFNADLAQRMSDRAVRILQATDAGELLPRIARDRVDCVCRLRGVIAHKIGGDRHFRSAHQPIRVAGSVYHKGGFVRAVTILEHRPHIECDLREFADRVSAMPLFPGVDSTADPEGIDKPSLRDVLTTPVHEGGVDPWTRFEGASAAIGHYIRLVHEGLLSPDDGWDGICQYNAAMLRPAWPLERLREEADRLWARHVAKNGPALLRAAAHETASPASMTAYKLRALLADTSPMPDDIIAPRVLTPGGMLVLGGAPKVGKSDFLISLLVHMAAGVAFLGFTPARPLRIYYLQAEIQYHYLRERLQSIRLDPAIIEAALDNLAVTPKLRLLLDAKGIALAAASIQEHFPDSPPDIICFDPIRNLFDGGPEGGGENDNTAMMFFLTERIELLRESIAPDCGVILVHHTKKLAKQQVKDDPFLALSGASALRGFYTSGMLLHRPDEESSQRRLEIELRNGPALPAKLVDKIKGEWVELNPMNERLVRQEVGAKNDAERLRKHDVILGILLSEAAGGRLYTGMQFAEKFENKAGLGSKYTIRDRLSVLATKGFIKFVKDAQAFGYELTRSRFGHLCVEGMVFGPGEETVDPVSGEVKNTAPEVLPTHFKCPQTGAALPVENPRVWVYAEGDESDPTHKS